VRSKREGALAKLITDSNKEMKVLQWQPKFNKIQNIIETVWKWHGSQN
jgi:UDP-glucose 4-epimerase